MARTIGENTVYGLLGGTFDPIHIGHLHIAWQVYQALPLSHISFMPCHQPVHRQNPKANSLQRAAMVKQAIQGIPEFCYEGCEIERDQPSYMIDSLRLLKQESDTSIVLIIGMDSLRQLDTWHQWQDLLNFCHLAVCKRSGEESQLTAKLDALYQNCVTYKASELTNKSAGLIYVIPDLIPLDVSATEVRKACGRHYPRFLVPQTVWQYIEDNELYQ